MSQPLAFRVATTDACILEANPGQDQRGFYDSTQQQWIGGHGFIAGTFVPPHQTFVTRCIMGGGQDCEVTTSSGAKVAGHYEYFSYVDGNCYCD